MGRRVTDRSARSPVLAIDQEFPQTPHSLRYGFLSATATAPVVPSPTHNIQTQGYTTLAAREPIRIVTA